MKHLILIISFFSQFSLASALDGVKSPDIAAKDFFGALKKGSKGLDKALESISTLNEDYERPNTEKNVKNKSFKEELKEIIVNEKQGQVTEYKMTSETVKLGGDMIKREYTVKFSGGQERTILFIFYRPTLDGSYHLMDSKFMD
jgi:hypothetical protein